MSTETAVAVTGANGYVGGLVVRALAPEVRIVPLVRRPRDKSEHVWRFDMDESEMFDTLRLASATQLVHVAWEMRTNSLEALRRVCVAGTRRLLTAARLAGVQNVIFVSTDLPAFYGPVSDSEMAFSGLVVDSRRLNSAGVRLPRLECGRISLN